MKTKNKKPVWYAGKIYETTTELSKAEKIGIQRVYQAINEDKPINGHFIDYVITFDDYIDQAYK